jgi:hypothetical protein
MPSLSRGLDPVRTGCRTRHFYAQSCLIAPDANLNPHSGHLIAAAVPGGSGCGSPSTGPRGSGAEKGQNASCRTAPAWPMKANRRRDCWRRPQVYPKEAAAPAYDRGLRNGTFGI